MNTAAGNSPDANNTTSAGANHVGSTGTDTPPTVAGPVPASASAQTPCPPAKKVVRNGGSNEPAIQLVGGTAAEKAEQRRTIDQNWTATEENLKKIAERHLTTSQHDMLTQVRQFMEQSEAAVVAGDLGRAHALAMKARLLSDELVKP